MDMRLKTFATLTLLLIINSTAFSKDKITYSGFLDSYPELQKGAKGGADWVYKKEGLDLSKYNKVMIDYVEFWISPDAGYKGVNARELSTLADAFYEALIENLKDRYPIVDKPDPGVLRVRCAITDLKPTKPGLDSKSSIIPAGLLSDSKRKEMTGVHAALGMATIEAEFLDAETNERLIVAIDRQVGRKYQFTRGVLKWGHVNAAFKFWAERIRKALDESRQE